MTKINDSYLAPAPLGVLPWNSVTDNDAYRQLVMCQEIGHDLGLAHQDENFTNSVLNTCMDYTSIDPELNQHPNLHDEEMLQTEIYDHTHGGGGGGGNTGGPPGGGKGKGAGTASQPPPAWD